MTVDRVDEATGTVAGEHRRRVDGLRLHAQITAASLVLVVVVNLVVNLAAGLVGEWWAWWAGWAVVGSAAALGVHVLLVRFGRPEGG